MTLEEKIDQILSMLHALDTRLGFIEDDLNVLKEGVIAINDTTVTLALNGTQSTHSGGGGDKSARVAEFHKESARW